MNLKGEDSAITPRVGMVWMPNERLSLYGSYARSFNPQLLTVFNLDTSESFAVSDPQEGTQFEIGVKHDFSATLSASLSAFHLTKTNVPTAGAGGIFDTQLTGEQQSRGVEFAIVGELPSGLQLNAGYAYTDTEITKSNEGDTGNRVFAAPEHIANAWISYTNPREGALGGLGGGVGIYHASNSFTNNANTVRLDGYTLLEAALWYRPKAADSRYSFALNLKNLTNERYFITGLSVGPYVQPGVPRTWLATVEVSLF